MKILVLNYEYPPLGGGAGVVTKNISEKLSQLGHSITVLTTWFDGEKEIDSEGNLKVIRLKSKRKYIYKSSVYEMLSWIYASKRFLREHLQQESFDLCLANYSIPGGAVALFLQNKFGLKYFILSHGHDIPWMFPRQMFFYHLILYRQIKKIYTRSQSNIVLTQGMKTDIDKFLGKKLSMKNIIIPNGIDPDEFKPGHPRSNNIFKIIFVGRLVEQKDPMTFLKAIKLYSEINRNIAVNIIGDGVMRQKMEDYIASHHLNSFVKFLGWIPKGDVLREYQTAHVQVISSVYEAMSVSMLESLACGCFLISTPLDGIKEILYEDINGVLANLKSSEEIAGLLNDYYKNNFLSGYTVPAEKIRIIGEKYSWDLIAKEYLKQFNNADI